MVSYARSMQIAIGWLFVAAIIIFSLTPEVPSVNDYTPNDKLAHFGAYGFVMGWFAWIYRSPGARISHAIFFIALGAALEFLQTLTATRSFELADLVADTLGVAVGLMASGIATARNRLFGKIKV